MFYSARAKGGQKKIAMARLFPIMMIDIDIRPGFILLPGKYRWWPKVKVAILSSEEFDAGSQVDQESLTFGRTGYEPSLKRCRKRLRDVNRDGLDDLICAADGGKGIIGHRPTQTHRQTKSPKPFHHKEKQKQRAFIIILKMRILLKEIIEKRINKTTRLNPDSLRFNRVSLLWLYCQSRFTDWQLLPLLLVFFVNLCVLP